MIHGMRGVGFLLMGLFWLPTWTWAGSSGCTGSDCSASVSVSFRIVIPPPSLTTKQFYELSSLAPKTDLSTEAVSSAPSANGQRNEITSLDGVIYVPTNDDAGISYTVTKP